MNSHTCRLYHDQEGQVLYLVAALVFVIIGMAALAIDIGFALHAQRELQASADAAATAGALDLSNDGLTASQAATAINDANLYSGQTGDKNADADLPGVKMASGYPALTCLTTCASGQTTGCVPGATWVPSCNNYAGNNAVVVKEQVNAPTFFAKLFGINSISLTASSLALAKGGTDAPSNIEVIIDTTASMIDAAGNCTISGISSPTQEDCAKSGVRTLLGQLDPCPLGQPTCGAATNGNIANPVDQVALWTFPGLPSTSPIPDDYLNCDGTAITTWGQYAPGTTTPPYMQIVPLSSDYKTSDANGLNGSTSDLVKAVDWADGAGCTSSKYGLQVTNGAGLRHTYVASVLQQAQSNLSNLGPPRSSLQSAIILLSDGNSTAFWCGTGGPSCSSEGVPSSDFTSTTPISYGQYECHQAITAAQTIAQTTNAAGLTTWIYSIAYGASTQAATAFEGPSYTGPYSCWTDGAPPGSPAPASNPISGCATMAQIPSDQTKFYSDDSLGCLSPDHPTITSLQSIFQNISNDFQTTRLLPASLYVPPQ
jgi:Flp pilus assembly protein TadG